MDLDYWANRLEGLVQSASELTMYDVKSAVNKAKAVVMNLSEMETKVRDATNDDPWGASSTLMQEIAQGTHNFQEFNEIMPAIYSRFTEKEARQWRQIYKSLVLLEYLVKNGSERVIDDARAHMSLVKVLRNFHYIDENGKDQGINIRNRSKELAELLSDLDKVRQERRKARQNRTKYTGVGNDGFGGGSGGPSFVTSTGSRYGGFGSDSFNSGGGGSSGGGISGSSGGFRSSFQDSRSEGFEEYDAGEWEDKDHVRSSNGSASVARNGSTASRSSRAEAPKPAPPKKEVNLFDFDDDDVAPAAPQPQTSSTGAAASLDDDFDDFQSANDTFTSAPAASSITTTSKPNAFELLQAQPAVRSPPALSPAASSSFQPLQPASRRPAMQPAQPSSTSVRSTASSNTTSSAATGSKPASDFSDLFTSFGGASGGAGAGGKGQPKMSMAQLAQQTRQEKLFGASGSSSSASQAPKASDPFDSLI